MAGSPWDRCCLLLVLGAALPGAAAVRPGVAAQSRPSASAGAALAAGIPGLSAASASPGAALAAAIPDSLVQHRWAGDICSHNVDCGGPTCSYKDAAESSPKICCATNRLPLAYKNKEYCHDMTTGSMCYVDYMCASNYCKGKRAILSDGETGTCTDKLLPGQACDRNEACSNSPCGHQSAADDAPLICCTGSNRPYSVLLAGINYCRSLTTGSTCLDDGMCDSQYCKRSCEGKTGDCKGTCADKLPDGQACEARFHCSSGACSRQTAEDFTLTCCDRASGGSTSTHKEIAYCRGMPAGSKCYLDNMCDSQHCDGNFGGIKQGTCRAVPLA